MVALAIGNEVVVGRLPSLPQTQLTWAWPTNSDSVQLSSPSSESFAWYSIHQHWYPKFCCNSGEKKCTVAHPIPSVTWRYALRIG